MEKVAAPVIILEANTHVAASETQNEHETRVSLVHFVTIMISAFMKCYQHLQQIDCMLEIGCSSHLANELFSQGADAWSEDGAW